MFATLLNPCYDGICSFWEDGRQMEEAVRKGVSLAKPTSTMSRSETIKRIRISQEEE
jgi:hypothetical protein